MLHGFEVRKKLKRFRVLIFALSILVSFCLAYPPNDSLGEIRFLSPNRTLGNLDIADQEDLVIDPPVSSKGIVSASFVNLSHLGIYPARDSVPFPFQPFFTEQKIPILRCWDNPLCNLSTVAAHLASICPLTGRASFKESFQHMKHTRRVYFRAGYDPEESKVPLPEGVKQ